MPGTDIANRNGYEYIINAMLIFAIMGMAIKVFFGNVTSRDGSYGRANSTIWGYGLVAMSILVVMFVNYAIHNKIYILKNKGISGIIEFLKVFLNSSLSSFLAVAIMIWIITLNIMYYKKINMGQVASEYYQLSAGTSLLFVFQIICIFTMIKLYISIEIDKTNAADASITLARVSVATYFITAISLVVTGMMTIILQFFSTDG